METHTYQLQDNGIFPNSTLPVVHYRNAIELSFFRPAHQLGKLFNMNGWSNQQDGGIFTYHHYHSNTHEVIGVYKGKTFVLLGGENGKQIVVHKGDILVIPAGVAHRNMGREKDACCITAYPDGKDYDIHTGEAGERPAADQRIAAVDLPAADPLLGEDQGICAIWRNMHIAHHSL
ncbi:Uncharacterized protein YjlB [Sediminibacterium ginsengisoli]|uniref:Uncharacterized protein YjlB n=2 Tax=Sediminibacterium ginsengisoli TaxID=413434 RepID=A0A1T4KS98_9BACT|nr:Uncharacterized protein YjlB [Sediminibacterium ginsengisoli]